jgi:replication-associated recombination protein RarA
VAQEYMPEGKKFYQPSDQGFEKEIAARLRGIWPGRYEKESNK